MGNCEAPTAMYLQPEFKVNISTQLFRKYAPLYSSSKKSPLYSSLNLVMILNTPMNIKHSNFTSKQTHQHQIHRRLIKICLPIPQF